MSIIYKILFFSLLWCSCPIGRLFEIFRWNDNIIKTEYVSVVKESNYKSTFHFVLNISKKITTNSIVSFYHKQLFVFRNLIHNTKSKLILFDSNNQFKELKKELLIRLLFNINFKVDSIPLLS